MCNCGKCEACREAGSASLNLPPRQLIFADGPEMLALAEENDSLRAGLDAVRDKIDLLKAQRDEAEERYHELARAPKSAEITIRLPEDMLEKIQQDALKIGMDNLAAEKASLEEEYARLLRYSGENLYHDDKTLEKVRDSLRASLGSPAWDLYPQSDADRINGLIAGLQNAGILFRERIFKS